MVNVLQSKQFEFDREPIALDLEPTSHPPGSPEKVAVLKRRFEAGQILYHPQDSKQVLPQAGRR